MHPLLWDLIITIFTVSAHEAASARFPKMYYNSNAF